MTNPEPDNGTTRDDLVKRIELMESMIAEGRGFTSRKAWIFVLWGLVDTVAVGWQNLFRHSHFAIEWAWPICLTAGVILTFLGSALQRHDHGHKTSNLCRSVGAVWAMMGLALGIYVAAAMLTHFAWQYSYLAGMLMMLGMAHAISAVILRWRVQGVVAAIWWAGGVAVLVLNSGKAANAIMFLEMCFGMIAFGLYAMWLESRNGGWIKKNA
jgi:hypothetical protein